MGGVFPNALECRDGACAPPWPTRYRRFAQLSADGSALEFSIYLAICGALPRVVLPSGLSLVGVAQDGAGLVVEVSDGPKLSERSKQAPNRKSRWSCASYYSHSRTLVRPNTDAIVSGGRRPGGLSSNICAGTSDVWFGCRAYQSSAVDVQYTAHRSEGRHAGFTAQRSPSGGSSIPGAKGPPGRFR
jgi:hypothetical protein